MAVVLSLTAHLLGEELLQAFAVGQAGEPVVGRLMEKLSLVALQPLEINLRADEPFRPATFIAERQSPAQDPAVVTVGLANTVLALEAVAFTGQAGTHESHQLLEVVGMDQVEPVLGPARLGDFVVPEHLAPMTRQVDAVGRKVPLPKAVNLTSRLEDAGQVGGVDFVAGRIGETALLGFGDPQAAVRKPGADSPSAAFRSSRREGQEQEHGGSAETPSDMGDGRQAQYAEKHDRKRRRRVELKTRD